MRAWRFDSSWVVSNDWGMGNRLGTVEEMETPSEYELLRMLASFENSSDFK